MKFSECENKRDVVYRFKQSVDKLTGGETIDFLAYVVEHTAFGQKAFALVQERSGDGRYIRNARRLVKVKRPTRSVVIALLSSDMSAAKAGDWYDLHPSAVKRARSAMDEIVSPTSSPTMFFEFALSSPAKRRRVMKISPRTQ